MRRRGVTLSLWQMAEETLLFKRRAVKVERGMNTDVERERRVRNRRLCILFVCMRVCV